MCPAHLHELLNKFGAGQWVSPPLALDLVKVFVLLQLNQAYCVELARSLEAEIGFARTLWIAHRNRYSDLDTRFDKQDPLYVKLSRALEFYEGYCWFPANRVLLGSLLTSEGFHEATSMGMNKDFGAGHKHGDQAHRLQWHVIMREITNHFTVTCDAGAGWSHAPLKLYYEYNHGQARTNLQTAIGKVDWWGATMDQASHGGWGNPERVIVSLRQSNLPRIAAAINRRVEKHGGTDLHAYGVTTMNFTTQRSPQSQIIYDNATHVIEELKKAKVGKLQLVNSLGNQTTFNKEEGLKTAIENYLYSWGKSGYPTAPPMNSTAWIAYKVYLRVKALQPQVLKTSFHYAMAQGGYMVREGAPDVGVGIGDRLGSCSGGFNPQYRFTQNIGAVPSIGQDNRW